MNELRTLHVGPVTLGWLIDAADPRWRHFLDGYAGYLDSAPAMLTVEAEVGPGRAGPPAAGGAPAPSEDTTAPPAEPLPNSLIRTRRLQGRYFELGGGLVSGTMASPDLCRCTISPLLLSGSGLRVLEQFIYLLFYQAAHGGAERPAAAPFLLHSAAALSAGGVHLFCGPPGSGKTTAVSHPGSHRVLADETAVIVPGEDGVRVESSPINPFYPGKVRGGGPLAGLYLLEQGGEHAVLPVARIEAIPRLTAEVMVPLSLLETDLSRGMARGLDCALLLWRAGRVRRLRLRPDAGFWPLLEAEA